MQHSSINSSIQSVARVEPKMHPMKIISKKYDEFQQRTSEINKQKAGRASVVVDRKPSKQKIGSSP
jgi:hypothetical protein